MGPLCLPVCKIGLKKLQEYSADDINIQHFQMQVYIAFEGLKETKTADLVLLSPFMNCSVTFNTDLTSWHRLKRYSIFKLFSVGPLI